MPDNAMLLELNDIKVAIDGEEAVRSSSFSIPEGSVAALIGESGSGKTLTAKAIAGILPERAVRFGSIKFCGKELTERNITGMRGKEIVYVFQDASASLNPVYRIEKQLRRIVKTADADNMLKAFGLAGKGRLYPFELSGGMQMRAVLMMAAALSPKILIADEITASLDSRSASSVMEMLMTLRRKDGSMLIITHDISIAEKYADYIAVMYAGETIEEGKAADVLGNPLHPYTAALIRCSKFLKDAAGRFYTIDTAQEGKENTGGCAYDVNCRRACGGSISWLDFNGHKVRCSNPLPFYGK